MNDPVRVGIIGAGAWAVGNHIPILAMRSDVDLVVAVRPEYEVLKQTQVEYSIGALTDDVDYALSMDLDAVVVASPPAFHFEHTAKALQAGANVLCEKPFTIWPEESRALDRLATDSGQHLLLSLGWHYRPSVIEAKRRMTSNGVGTIQHVMVAMASGIRGLLDSGSQYGSRQASFTPEQATWTSPATSGGGYAPAQLSHALGLLSWLSELQAEEVFAFTYLNSSDIDIHDTIAVRFVGGATGSISGAVGAAPPANAVDRPDEPWPRHQLQLRIFGDRGQLVLDLERDFLWHFHELGIDQKPKLPSDAGLYTCDGPPNTLVELTKGEDVPNRSPASAGVFAVEIVSAALQSAATRSISVIEHD